MIVPVVFAAGLGLIALLGLRPRTGIGLLGSAFFLGVLGLGLWTHILLFVRIPVGLPSVLAGAGLLAAGIGLRGRPLFRVEWPRPTLAAIPLLLSGAFALAGALSWPYLGFDGEIFYALRAKSILQYGTFWNPDFLDPARLHLGARRPLLLPSIYADFALLSGTMDARLLRVWFALVHLSALAVVADRFRLSPLWLAVLAWLPAFWHDSGGVFSGYADATLAMLFLLGFDALREGDRRFGAFTLSAAVLLKQDAWPFLAVVAMATLVTRPRELPRTVGILVVPALAVVTWTILSSRLAPQPDLGPPNQMTLPTMAASLAWWPDVLGRLGSDLVKPKHWGLFWVVAMGALLLRAPRLSRDDARWLLVILLQLLVYVAALATYREEIVMATRTQGMRLLLHLAPLMWLWVGREPVSRSSF